MAAWGVPADPIPATVAWRQGRLRLLDQRALPERVRYVTCASVTDVVDAIRRLVVRGAPAARRHRRVRRGARRVGGSVTGRAAPRSRAG